MKKVITMLSMAAFSVIGSVAAFAADTVDVTSIMETSMQGVQSDIMKVLAIAVPILAAIVGVTVAIKFGMKYIKKVGS